MEKIRNTPFPAWPSFAPDEVDAAADVLRSGRVNQWTGEQVKHFEREYADFVGTKHAVAVANGTLALELALRALGIGAGDEVIVPSRTFIATASAVIAVGGTPVCCDIDPDSNNLTADTIAPHINDATKAIIAVHLAGWMAPMDEIMALAKKHNLYVIEDCAQAHGATYKGRMAGSIGHINAHSFCQDKIMTTGGEGGMVTTNDDTLFRAAWEYKDHGKSYEAVYERDHPPGFRWLHEGWGSNWRMTEIQAAIGRVILGKLPKWLEVRRRHGQRLNDAFAKHSQYFRVTLPGEEYEHAYYKYLTFVRPENLPDGWDRDRIVETFVAAGIPCFQGFCAEIYLEKAFTNSGLGPAERFATAKVAGETSIMLLVHPTIADTDLDDVLHAIDAVVQEIEATTAAPSA